MQFTPTEIIVIIILATFIFLLAPLFLLIYIKAYNSRKAKDLEEKRMMQLKFESELLKTQIEVQEQTMQTIATDLHDNIGQLLSLTNLTLGSVDLKNIEKSAKKIENSINLVNISIKELRDLAKLFQGEQLIEIGLSHALQQEVNWLEKSERYNIQANIELADVKVQVPDKDLIILRLLQEIINNIIKHAEATVLFINAYIKDGFFYLTVKDNGIGFDYDQTMQVKSGGLGLHSLNKRVQLINGKINIESSAKGTNIDVEIPYP